MPWCSTIGKIFLNYARKSYRTKVVNKSGNFIICIHALKDPSEISFLIYLDSNAVYGNIGTDWHWVKAHRYINILLITNLPTVKNIYRIQTTERL